MPLLAGFFLLSAEPGGGPQRDLKSSEQSFRTLLRRRWAESAAREPIKVIAESASRTVARSSAGSALGFVAWKAELAIFARMDRVRLIIFEEEYRVFSFESTKFSFATKRLLLVSSGFILGGFSTPRFSGIGLAFIMVEMAALSQDFFR